MKGATQRLGRISAHIRSYSMAGEANGMSSWMEKIEKSISTSRSIRGGNYVQIATVDSKGLPHCRTVVFRGFLDAAHGMKAFKMITDARSEKVAQIQHSPACELVWWFAASSEQYRVQGTLELISHESQNLQDARLKQWQELSDAAREQFFWTSPGLYDPEHQSQVPVGGRNPDQTILPPPEAFLLMLLIPQEVRYLRLQDNYSQLDTLSDNVWVSSRMNP